MTNQTLADDAKVRIHPRVMLQQVGNEAVLLHLDTGVYYGLNPVGARMVEMLHEGADVGTACQTLLQEYDVDAERLRRDLEYLVSEMRTRELVTVEP